MLDASVIVFVVGLVTLGVLLTAAIRRDFVDRRRLRRDVQRQTDHLRARRRPAARP